MSRETHGVAPQGHEEVAAIKLTLSPPGPYGKLGNKNTKSGSSLGFTQLYGLTVLLFSMVLDFWQTAKTTEPGLKSQVPQVKIR